MNRLDLVARAFRCALLAAGLCLGAAVAANDAAAPSQLSAQRLDGRPVSLADGKGRTVLVIFWSPESLASRKSLPELQRFIDESDRSQIFILAVSTSGEPKALESFLAARALDLPVALRGDDDFGAQLEWQLPIAYVFDDAGRFLRRRAGLFNTKILRTLTAPDAENR